MKIGRVIERPRTVERSRVDWQPIGDEAGYWPSFFAEGERYGKYLIVAKPREGHETPLWWLWDGWTIGQCITREDAIRSIDITEGRVAEPVTRGSQYASRE